MKSEEIRKIAIFTKKGYNFIEPQQIVHCQSDGNYTILYLAGNKKRLVCRQMGLIAKDLPSDLFMRVHHSHIINLLFLERYESKGLLWLNDGEIVPVSRRRRKEVMGRMKNS